MKRIIICFMAMLLCSSLSISMANEPIRVIVFGAHPDDSDLYAGGTAALFAKMGHKVKFVSLTNGDKGHHTMSSKDLADRRAKEMQESAKILGIVYEHLDNHDGELMPTLENRMKVIKLICDWEADIVITHRPNDYHPDHRYASTIVQDAAYMISVPKMVPDGKALLKTPLFLYMKDSFKKPAPFSPDIVIDITSVTEQKLAAICAHESQVFEWLPWNGGYADQITNDRNRDRELIKDHFLWEEMSEDYIMPALKWYTLEQVNNIKYYEAFEVCEYGREPNEAETRELFPMLPQIRK